MSDFGTALLRLWPNGDEKIPPAGRHDRLSAGGIRQIRHLHAAAGRSRHGAGISGMWRAGHEVIEDLSYSAQRAHEVWPGRFPTDASAMPYAHNPKALGNHVYGGRMGNRPGTDDGSVYLGRGFAQITGRDEYQRLGKMVGLDLVDHPELLLDPTHFLACGVANLVLCGCLPLFRRGRRCRGRHPAAERRHQRSRAARRLAEEVETSPEECRMIRPLSSWRRLPSRSRHPRRRQEIIMDGRDGALDRAAPRRRMRRA